MFLWDLALSYDYFFADFIKISLFYATDFTQSHASASDISQIFAIGIVILLLELK